jgi:hypothetical protein
MGASLSKVNGQQITLCVCSTLFVYMPDYDMPDCAVVVEIVSHILHTDAAQVTGISLTHPSVLCEIFT